MMMRKAVVVGSAKPLKIIEEAIPKPPPEGAVVKTINSGICHSDIHLIDDHFEQSDGEIWRPSEAYGERYLGWVSGHEIGGVIHSFGEKANPEALGLKIGDRVCVYPWLGCTECYNCKAGENNTCEFNPGAQNDIAFGPDRPGGFSTHVSVPQCQFLLKIPDSVPMSVACLLPCSASTAYSALLRVSNIIEKALATRGEANLLVIGAGGLGLWAVQLANKGVYRNKKVNITVADINGDKVEAAKQLGASRGVVWQKGASVEEMASAVTETIEGRMDAIINFVGNQATSEVSLKVLHKWGCLVPIGLYGGSLNIVLPSFITQNLTISGVRVASLNKLKDLIQLVSDLDLAYDLCTLVKLEDINEAIAKVKAGQITGRAILEFE